MEQYIKKSRKTRKQGNTYITSIPKEVIEALSLSEGDQLEFTIKNDSVSLDKKLLVDTQNIPKTFYEEIDYFMNKYDETFKNLVER
ncbi:AbrB/MazE/SpoVT family DNA-binding domain-containing protein [Pisciglobus halotolerans]|uniref:Putative addiction module antidote n=1 Tax=Pisciglobus halotolerans TaxID=745365 RepID=A0A1I3AXG6_9LACT|nr:AbrB/MazE/SpoVT family DNA-binding domain-containing protein [Pisciglobus halotolerans]SFH54818.1 putative addiction module antidote [Pisciglobus halotolerans]